MRFPRNKLMDDHALNSKLVTIP